MIPCCFSLSLNFLFYHTLLAQLFAPVRSTGTVRLPSWQELSCCLRSYCSKISLPINCYSLSISPHNLQRLVPRQFNKHITSKMVIVVPARRPRQLSQEKSGNHQTWQDWHGNIIKALQPPLNDVEKLFRETESGREKIKKLEEGKATFTARPLCICNDAYKS